MMNALLFTVPFLVSATACFFLTKVKTNWFIDEPGLRKIHRVPIIRAGGIALYLSFVAGFLLADTDVLYSNFLFTSLTVFFVIGLLDDNYHFRSFIKFSLPFFSSLVISWYYIQTFTSSDSFLVIIFVSFWIFFNVNAFNMIDGIDSLCSTVCLLTLLGLLVLSIIKDLNFVYIWSQIIISSLLAFFIFNRPPAKIFLGDSGSHQLGFLVSVLILFIFKEENIGMTLYDYFYLDYLLIFMLVFIVGYPNFDAIYSTLTRIKNGKLPWIGDNNHPHYKFLKLGFSNIKILFVINGIHCFFILSAFLLLFYSKLFPIIIAINLLFVVYLVSLLESVDFENLAMSEQK